MSDRGGEVDRLAGMPAGPELLAALGSVALDELDAHDTIAVISAWERLARHVAAGQLTAMAGLPDRGEYLICTAPEQTETAHVHRSLDPAGDELSLALTVSPARAKAMLVRADELTHELPDTLVALAEGRLDQQRACLIADRTRVLPDLATRRAVEATVLPRAPRQTLRQLDRALRHAVIAADPHGAERRQTDARTERRVSRPEPDAIGAVDGMARLQLVGPAEDLVALYTALDAAARHRRERPDETRTLDQLRFDLLTGLGWNALDLGHLGCCNRACAGAPGRPGQPEDPGRRGQPGDLDSQVSTPLAVRHGRAAAVHVTVALSSLLGADDEPAELEGFGPITAGAARQVSARGTLHRALTDDAGVVLDYGQTRYRPPPGLVDAVAVRDVTCRFPTCSHPARGCDTDHRRPWADGGATSGANLWALHDGHHLGKTHHGFRVVTDPTTGVIFWVTPAGNAYPVEPEVVGLTTAADPRDGPPADVPPF